MTPAEFMRHAYIIADYLDEMAGPEHQITLSMYALIWEVVKEGVQEDKEEGK